MIIEYSFDNQFDKDMKSLFRMNHAYELRNLDGIGEDHLDLNEFSRKFYSQNTTVADLSIDDNSNVGYATVAHYDNEINKSFNKIYGYFLLWKYGRRLYNEEFSKEALKKQFTKEIYINDMVGYSHKPYCFNFSCMDIVCNGLPFSGQVKPKPAKHLSSFCQHITSFIQWGCKQILGSCGIADLLICCSWYIEKLYKENANIPKEYLDNTIKQELQGLIYQFNQPFKGSLESPFTNVSIYDDIFLTKLCEEYIFPDGSKVSKETVKATQEMFLDIFNKALKEQPLTFPVVTACFAIDEGKLLDTNFLDFIVEKNIEFGFINIYAGKTSTLSSCCRLRSDNDNEYFNQFGSGSTKIGSLGVVTLNLPRLAYISKNEEDFFNRLKENVIIASRINNVKRHIAKNRIDSGFSPLYSLGFANLNRQYSTCGIVGVNETCEILGYDILKEKGQSFVTKILDVINKTNDEQQKKYKTPHNVEQVPGESSSLKLAEADGILGYNTKYSFYSNQFMPLTKDANILDRLDLQGKFDSHMTGGAICHINIEDKITDSKFMKNLIVYAIERGVVYHAINYNLQQCGNGHITVGKSNKCHICGKDIESNFTRVVGFLTNVKQWSKKRREEDYPNRKFYKED